MQGSLGLYPHFKCQLLTQLIYPLVSMHYLYTGSCTDFFFPLKVFPLNPLFCFLLCILDLIFKF